jgi:catechol 2,3-dioxygenase-like lactoylglutathione lyase family enzyme
VPLQEDKVDLTKICAGAAILGGLSFAPVAHAQQLVPTAPPDHIHYYVPDTDKALTWYMKHFGGERVKDPRPNLPDEILYGKTVFRFSKRDDSQPADGSVIDRVGFTVDNVDAKTQELVADGAKVLQKPTTVAFLQDPWGGKIEILHPDNTPTNRLFLIALHAADPAPLEKWVADTFGGTPDKLLGRFDGIKYGDVWVLFQQGDGVPSKGHTIDHLGWAVPNMNDTIANAKAKGYKVTTEPRSLGAMTIAYIEGPNGLSIELTQLTPGGEK